MIYVFCFVFAGLYSILSASKADVGAHVYSEAKSDYKNLVYTSLCFDILAIDFIVMFSNGLPCNLPFPSCLGVPKDCGSDELLPTSMGNREPVILNVYDMVGHMCV